MQNNISKTLVLMASCAALGACSAKSDLAADQSAVGEKAVDEIVDGWGDVTASFVDRESNAAGHASFKQGPHGVIMRIAVSGLEPGWHGMHFHQVADCSDGAAGFKASGGHVNPTNKLHGLLNEEGYHYADLPNIFADGNGRAVTELFSPVFSLDIGDFAVIVHESPDDHVSQPIGGAGGRVACAAVTQ